MEPFNFELRHIDGVVLDGSLAEIRGQLRSVPSDPAFDHLDSSCLQMTVDRAIELNRCLVALIASYEKQQRRG
jgi:hypothetical protein